MKTIKKNIGKNVTTNGSNMYVIICETDDQVCLQSRIDGKLEIFEKKKISLYETKDCLIRGKK